MEITLVEINEFMNMLIGGKLPDGVLLRDQPCLTRRQACSVTWYLQEHLHIIPDHYEMCAICESWFDTHTGGRVVDGTDEPDDWQQSWDVTQEMLKAASGAAFCSNRCEAEY